MGDGTGWRNLLIGLGAIGTGAFVFGAVRAYRRAHDSELEPARTSPPLPRTPPRLPSSPGPAPAPSPANWWHQTFLPLVERWRPEVAQRAGDLPVDPLLQWVDMESGGDMGSTGASTEVGIWQLNLPGGNDDSKYGATLAGLRALAQKSNELAKSGHNAMDLSWMTPAEMDMQVGAGIRKVLAARQTVREALAASGISWPETSYDFGAAVKQIHASPAVIGELIPKVTKMLGRPPASWDEFHHAAMEIPADQMSGQDSKGRSYGLRLLAKSPSKHKLKSRLEDTLANAEIFGRAWAKAYG